MAGKMNNLVVVASSRPTYKHTTRREGQGMKITQHIPNCVDMGKEPKVAHFNNTHELLCVPWVKHWSEDPKFFRYSMSEESLMAEFKKGKEWWVIGNINHPEGVQLPKWVPVKGKK